MPAPPVAGTATHTVGYPARGELGPDRLVLRSGGRQEHGEQHGPGAGGEGPFKLARRGPRSAEIGKGHTARIRSGATASKVSETQSS